MIVEAKMDHRLEKTIKQKTQSNETFFDSTSSSLSKFCILQFQIFSVLLFSCPTFILLLLLLLLAGPFQDVFLLPHILWIGQGGSILSSSSHGSYKSFAFSCFYPFSNVDQCNERNYEQSHVQTVWPDDKIICSILGHWQHSLVGSKFVIDEIEVANSVTRWIDYFFNFRTFTGMKLWWDVRQSWLTILQNTK